MSEEIFWCSTCLNASTRPRIGFDDSGRCNACVWAETKKTLDWDSRLEELAALLDKHRSSNGQYDCLVPVSGGKDGSYVAYQLKHKYGMNPLAVTVTPALSLEIGDRNLKSFINSGFDHIQITPNPEVMRILNTKGLIEMGFPYYAWLIAIKSAVIRTALQHGISLIFYGEDGEVEYGGSTETSTRPTYDFEYIKRVYFEGGDDRVLGASGVSDTDKYWYSFPSDIETSEKGLEIVHWSYFENWDPYRNYLVAKEHCGLAEVETTNAGTFTNFAQNDQALYSLHAYLMYLKFGFGRATQDAGIEVRRGAMTREQAVNLVRMFDGQYPAEFEDLYLEYFNLTNEEFHEVLNSFTNTKLFELTDSTPIPKFTIE